MFVIEYKFFLYFFQNDSDKNVLNNDIFGQKILNGTYSKEYRVPKEDILKDLETKDIKFKILYDKKKPVNSEHRHHSLHSTDDYPARIDFENFKLEWFANGRLHREDDKPAVVTFTPDGCLYSLEWYYAGFRHRDNNRPAVIYYDDNECEAPRFLSKEWWLNGKKQLEPLIKPGKKTLQIGFEYIDMKDIKRCIRKVAKITGTTIEHATQIILQYNPLPLKEDSSSEEEYSDEESSEEEA